MVRDDCNGGYFCEVPQQQSMEPAGDVLQTRGSTDIDPNRSRRPDAGQRPAATAISTDASKIVAYDAGVVVERPSTLPEARPGQERTDSSAASRFADGVRGKSNT